MLQALDGVLQCGCGMAGHLLTFELSEKGDELSIHGDPGGLRLLAARLSDLAARAEGGAHGSGRLTTSIWGGNELSLQPQGTGTRLIYHVRLNALPKGVP
jgi:hypothetical protein